MVHLGHIRDNVFHPTWEYLGIPQGNQKPPGGGLSASDLLISLNRKGSRLIWTTWSLMGLRSDRLC